MVAVIRSAVVYADIATRGTCRIMEAMVTTLTPLADMKADRPRTVDGRARRRHPASPEVVQHAGEAVGIDPSIVVTHEIRLHPSVPMVPQQPKRRCWCRPQGEVEPARLWVGAVVRPRAFHRLPKCSPASAVSMTICAKGLHAGTVVQDAVDRGCGNPGLPCDVNQGGAKSEIFLHAAANCARPSDMSAPGLLIADSDSDVKRDGIGPR